MKHRRGVHSGAVCAGAASRPDRSDERARGGADVWVIARDGAQDVEVFSAAFCDQLRIGQQCDRNGIDFVGAKVINLYRADLFKMSGICDREGRLG